MFTVASSYLPRRSTVFTMVQLIQGFVVSSLPAYLCFFCSFPIYPSQQHDGVVDYMGKKS